MNTVRTKSSVTMQFPEALLKMASDSTVGEGAFGEVYKEVRERMVPFHLNCAPSKESTNSKPAFSRRHSGNSKPSLL